MFNTVFCQPGTKVVSIESSIAFADNHATLFASLGHRYAIIFGERDISDDKALHYRWTIDVRRIIDAIRAFL